MQVVSLTPKGWRGLSEVPQQYLNYFSYARKEGDTIKQLHPWIKCRDYLLDGMFWTRMPSLYKAPVYGYPRIEDVNVDEMELLFQCPKGLIKDQIGVLNGLEDELGISHTTVERVNNTDWYIRGDGWWMKTTLHISAYTIILRTLSFRECKDWADLERNIQDNFGSIKGKLKKAIMALKTSGYDRVLPHKDPKEYDKDTLHNTAGIYTFVVAVQNGYEQSYNYGELVNAYKS